VGVTKERSVKARASFVIPTRGRVQLVADLLKTIEKQTTPAEVLIMDDGGSAELAETLARDFPGVQYHSLGTGRGPGFQRNRGIELATADTVFPIDDDTVLPSPNTVQQTVDEFSDPRIAAVAIPYANVRYETLVRHRAPDAGSVWINHAFTGASHAIRRSAFLEAGGYREQFFYMGEEGDLCLRLLNRGYVVRVGAADPIHHLESPLRNSALADFCGRRNDLAFAWHNVPSSRLPLHLAGTTLNGFVSSLRAPNPISALRGMASGFAEIAKGNVRRDPVTAQVYRLQRLLKKSGPLRLTEIEGRLPRRLAGPPLISAEVVS
jgi:GT2 family glycosyltransferase